MNKNLPMLTLGVLVMTGSAFLSADQSTLKEPNDMNMTRDSSFFAARLHDVYAKGMPRVVMSDAEWKKVLSPEQYRITREQGTEPPFCGLLNDEKRPGIYSCICCGLPLFSSDAKFKSGTGWPSFFQPVRKDHIVERTDSSWGMVRTEINCGRCGAHLGHVFDDGPRPTGLRYCLNSESLFFTAVRK